MTKIKVEVTQDDIDMGLACSASCCPIALAVKRTLRENGDSFGGVFVGSKAVRVQRKEYAPSIHYNLPVEAVDFIIAFDDGHDVKPFILELERMY